MAALLGLDIPDVEEIIAAAGSEGIVAIANDNTPGQIVVSGAVKAVERATELAKAKGARRAIMLDVSAPFHCPLLQPAADAMQEALAAIAMDEPSVPLIANVTAAPVTDPEEIRRLLVEQVTATVRWRESVMAMKALHVSMLVEMGGGKVLTGMVRRIDRDLTGVAVEGPDEIEAFLGKL